MIKKSGVKTVSQSPLLRGINDDPVVLRELFEKLSNVFELPIVEQERRGIRGHRGCLVVTYH